jgi:hypothetical protein
MKSRYAACVAVCIAAVTLGGCSHPTEPMFCRQGLKQKIFTVFYVNSPDKDTQAIKPDAEVLRRNILDHAAGGGPSSPLNDASWQRFRAFTKKKCQDWGRGDYPASFPEAMSEDRTR